MKALVALDAGTGSGKCAVFAPDGKLLGLHREPWRYRVRSDPAAPFMAEIDFDAGDFWQILCRCTQIALARAGVAPADVVGIATTSQREGCVFLDAAGKEIYAGPNLDSRGFAQGLEVLSAIGPQRLYEITGHTAPFIFPLARLLWFREHDRREVARLLMLNDWMTWRLSGEWMAEPSNGTESMLFDLRAREWSAELLDRFSIPRSILPPIRPSGIGVGAVTAGAARATGLREGTPVFSGGADTQCALLGAGAVEPGDTAAILGTTTPLQTVTERPLFDPRVNLWAGCHVVPERWVLESNLGDTGDAYQWILDLAAAGHADRHAAAEALARAAAPGGAYSYVGPEIFNVTAMRPDRPGAVFFHYPGLHQRPSAGDLIRSFFENVGFAARANLAQLEEVTGRRTERLLLGGGLTRSTLLLEILTDVLGLPVQYAEQPDSTALGCAIQIASAAGIHPNLPAALQAMSRRRQLSPDPARHETYTRNYEKWRELYGHLEQLSLAV